MYYECITPTVNARKLLSANVQKPPRQKRIRHRPNQDNAKMFGGTTPMHFKDDESMSTFSVFTENTQNSKSRVKDLDKGAIAKDFAFTQNAPRTFKTESKILNAIGADNFDNVEKIYDLQFNLEKASAEMR